MSGSKKQKYKKGMLISFDAVPLAPEEAKALCNEQRYRIKLKSKGEKRHPDA